MFSRSTRFLVLNTSQTLFRVSPQVKNAIILNTCEISVRSCSWTQKLTGFFGGSKGEAEKEPEEDDLSLNSYLKYIDKLAMMQKMGLGGAVEKMLGVSLDSSHYKMFENQKKLKDVLNKSELSATTFNPTEQRRKEITAGTGLSSAEIDQVVAMYTHIRRVKTVMDEAKAQGNAPKSVEDIRKLIGGIMPTPPTPPSPPRPPTPPSPPSPPTPPRPPTPSNGFTQQISADRFTAVPKKEKVVRGRNDWVKITDGTSVQELKWKKAESLVESGKWKIVE
eukprot:c14932_g1_i1.p1 GENE.c14932_g1_i1~~c14932_g1_i1.p1  ORF type:complete len:278 (-),score=115.52 c14932_g1_i1:152-985(-)